jgi:uncharacterized glyoxalase superfamily protein PhnB
MDTQFNQPDNISNRSMPPGTIIPELVYDDLGAAVDWLCQTFGFKERLRIGNHRSQLVFGGASVIAVARSGAGVSEPGQDWPTHALMVRIPDVNHHYLHVDQSGARILHPPETYPFGERQYTVEDLGGHRWTFTQSVADVAPEQWGGQLR